MRRAGGAVAIPKLCNRVTMTDSHSHFSMQCLPQHMQLSPQAQPLQAKAKDYPGWLVPSTDLFLFNF